MKSLLVLSLVLSLSQAAFAIEHSVCKSEKTESVVTLFHYGSLDSLTMAKMKFDEQSPEEGTTEITETENVAILKFPSGRWVLVEDDLRTVKVLKAGPVQPWLECVLNQNN